MFTYVASPYYHPDPVVRDNRYKIVCAYCAHCFLERKAVFSPIAHWHPIAEAHSLPAGFEHWEYVDYALLERANAVHVLAFMDGWDTSRGVRAEVEYARKLNIPIHHIYTFPVSYHDKPNRL